MIIGGKKNKNRYFIQIGLCVVLLLSSIQLIPFENQIIDNATACSKWTQSTQDDFKSGILNNLTISTTGEVKLAQETTYKKDEFINELKIAVKNNVIIDTIMTEVRPSTFKNTSFFKIFGGKSDDNGQSVQQTSDGGYIIVGTTRSYGAGKRDIQLIKADSLGILEWNKTFGGNLDDWGNSVQQTADDGYIIAGTTESFGAGKHDGWLIKTNSFGIMEWNKTFGGSNSEGIASVQQYFGNDYILVGSTSSYGAGGYDIWLIKTDNN